MFCDDGGFSLFVCVGVWRCLWETELPQGKREGRVFFKVLMLPNFVMQKTFFYHIYKLKILSPMSLVFTLLLFNLLIYLLTDIKIYVSFLNL